MEERERFENLFLIRIFFMFSSWKVQSINFQMNNDLIKVAAYR